MSSAPVTKLILEYDGTNFAGWAAQPGKRTVARELERALSTVLREPVDLVVAGRTDRGVHALGQVVSYSGEQPPLRSVNALLPDSVAVTAIESASPGFSARHDAISRTYLYRIHTRESPSPFERNRALWWPHRVDEDGLHQCARALVGLHDFTAFTPSESYHHRFERRVTQALWRRASSNSDLGGSTNTDTRDMPASGDILEFWIEGETFMRHMNRVLIGTMLEVAGGRRSVDDFVKLLEGRPRAEAGATAPPHGLYLASVKYAQ